MLDHDCSTTAAESRYGYCRCGCGKLTTPYTETRRKNGVLVAVKGEPRQYIQSHHFCRPLAQRFWEKVNRAGPDDCWVWSGARDAGGYGLIYLDGKHVLAHRIAYKMQPGAEPGDQDVLHRCDNPPCQNAGHLFLGTQADNNADMFSKGRHANPRGSRHGNAKLTEHLVIVIRQRYRAGGITQRELAAEYGVSQGAIFFAIHGHNWSQVALQ